MSGRWTAAAAVASGLILFVACAYYNIFWMAEREYRRAVNKVDFADFSDPYAKKPLTGDALKNVDSCVKRCGKILLLYPKSKWVDDALFLMGNGFVLKDEYDNALRKYDELLKFYPTSEFVNEAKYMRAYTLVLEDEHDQALGILDDLGGDVKAAGMKEKVLFLTARIYKEDGDCGKAADYLDSYIAAFPDGKKTGKVRLALGDCLRKLGREAEAITALQPLTSREGLDGALAQLQIGRAYRSIGENDRALEAFDRLAGKVLEDSLKARAKMEAGVTLEDEGKFEEAILALTTADSVGKQTLGGEPTYRIGLIYEKRLEDFDKATASYDAAGKGTSEFAKLAAKRAKALRAISKYEKSLSDSKADHAMARFMMAETFLLDLGFVDRAVEQYKAVSDSFPRSEYAARSMLALGSLLEARGDTSAELYYKTVIDSFSTSIYANVARFRLAMPQVDIALPEPEPSLDTAPTAVGPQAPTPEAPLSPTLPDTAAAAPDSLGERVGRPRRDVPDTSGDLGDRFSPFWQDTTGEAPRHLPPWASEPADTAARDTVQWPEPDWGDE